MVFIVNERVACFLWKCLWLPLTEAGSVLSSEGGNPETEDRDRVGDLLRLGIGIKLILSVILLFWRSIEKRQEEKGDRRNKD